MARPFDAGRAGLNVGEAAAYALLMSEEGKAGRSSRPRSDSGLELSDDAKSHTGPCRESAGLILAIGKALASAATLAEEIDFISAHGTGTVYND